MVKEQNELRDQYAHIVESNYTVQGQTRPPSVVATASTSTNTGMSSNSANTVAPTMSYNDVQEMIKKALQSVTPGVPTNNPITGTPQHQKPKRWRQWRSWCYTCGVNLNHNSSNCRRSKRPGHDANPEATMENPQGGNTSKN